MPIAFNTANPQLTQARPSAEANKSVKVDSSQQILERKRLEAEQVAQDFETMFIDLMVKSMRQTAQPEDMSNAEDIYQGMLDSEYAKSMTTTNSFGIREQILNWLEQTDSQLKQSKDQTSQPLTSKPSTNTHSTSASNLLSEGLALKAASQAYQSAAHSR